MAILELQNGVQLDVPDGLPKEAYDEIVDDYMSRAGGQTSAQQPTQDTGPGLVDDIKAGIAGAADSASMGTIDNIAAGVSTAVQYPFQDQSVVDLYNSEQERIHNLIEGYQADSPKSFLAGQIGGGIGLMALTRGAVKPQSLLAKLGTDVATGTLQGAGMSGDRAANSGSDVQSAIIGGALFGGGLTAAAGGAGMALNGARRAVGALASTDLGQMVTNKVLPKILPKPFNKVLPTKVAVDTAVKMSKDDQINTIIKELGPDLIDAFNKRTSLGEYTRLMSEIGKKLDPKTFELFKDYIKKNIRVSTNTPVNAGRAATTTARAKPLIADPKPGLMSKMVRGAENNAGGAGIAANSLVQNLLSYQSNDYR